MALKSKSGKQAVLFNVTKGALIIGDGTAPLADNSWFLVDKKAGTSALPFEIGYPFKSPDPANAITPAVGDEVYPLTFSKICKADASMSTEKGSIDTTDDCSDGYNSSILDGFVTISGSGSGFLKFDEATGDLGATQKEYLSQFFAISEDNGAGVYALTPLKDSETMIAILKNSDQTSVGLKQQWLLVPAIITSTTLDNPLKGVQNFDFNWTKGEGKATLYQRITNATETAW